MRTPSNEPDLEFPSTDRINNRTTHGSPSFGIHTDLRTTLTSDRVERGATEKKVRWPCRTLTRVSLEEVETKSHDIR